MAKRGRPPKANPNTENFIIRVTPETKEFLTSAGTAAQWRRVFEEWAQNPTLLRDAAKLGVIPEGVQIHDTQKEG